MESKVIPSHVGFIMDGNGRWAKGKGMPRNYGHTKGANNVDLVVSKCFEKGIKVVSLYAFSTENWTRPKQEVDKILALLHKFLIKYTKKLITNQVRLVISGDLNVLPEELAVLCREKMEITKNFEGKILNIALNYGGRQEILMAVNNLLKQGKTEITEEDFMRELYTANLPDIDLIVRTSGEQRLSNFFPYQSVYAELYFTNAYWPDFNEEELQKALDWYAERNRRFGGV
ncbi:MAG: di-trans,poly-cis-decaprenylcistransferase [Clostridia bacterium]|nr:di-trans,poly-cis-decaprenylcistransferase [Clostridia bacterium]